MMFRADALRSIYHLTFVSVRDFQLNNVFHDVYTLAFFIWPVILVDIYQRKSDNRGDLDDFKWPIQSILIGLMIVAIVIFGVRESNEFIYFVF